METKRKALGRGLEQLFSSENLFVQGEGNKIAEEVIEINTNEEKVVLIDIKDLRPNPYQPRQKFDQEKLNELSESIKVHGVLEPIIVKKSIKGFEIVAGERRTRASELAGIDKIPAIIKELTDEQMMQVALLENIQREDLNVLEEAEAYSKLLTSLNITQEELASKVGKSRSHITNLLGLLRLPDKVKNDVLENSLSLGHAKILSKLDNIDLIIELAEKVKSDSLSVRALELLVAVPEIKRIKEIRKTRVSGKYAFVEETMRDVIGSNVKVKNNSIVIPFVNEKDLERILEIINIKVKVD